MLDNYVKHLSVGRGPKNCAFFSIAWLVLGWHLLAVLACLQRLVGAWLVLGWCLVVTWLLRGWRLVGAWLVLGWYLVGAWLVLGWCLVGAWLVLPGLTSTTTLFFS
jgi:hypothetical protein